MPAGPVGPDAGHVALTHPGEMQGVGVQSGLPGARAGETAVDRVDRHTERAARNPAAPDHLAVQFRLGIPYHNTVNRFHRTHRFLTSQGHLDLPSALCRAGLGAFISGFDDHRVQAGPRRANRLRAHDQVVVEPVLAFRAAVVPVAVPHHCVDRVLPVSAGEVIFRHVADQLPVRPGLQPVGAGGFSQAYAHFVMDPATDIPRVGIQETGIVVGQPFAVRTGGPGARLHRDMPVISGGPEIYRIEGAPGGCIVTAQPGVLVREITASRLETFLELVIPACNKSIVSFFLVVRYG